MTLSRARTITVEAFEQTRKLPPLVRATAEGLRMHADDHGRGYVELRQILADVYPETSEVTESVLVDHLLMLAEAEVITLYEHGDRSCYQFTLWGRVDRPGDTRVPQPPPFARASRDSRETFAAGEREGAGESARASAGESEREREAQSARISREVLPPDPFCPDHPGGVMEPCIACQNARLRNKHFLDVRRWEMRQGADDEPF
ncbi:hypothetical protein [Microbacterium sp. cx-59]|uniref:hypothetical protein n=1 Tax=Microbacterium sp. cx-59 TaxID=2891207 RepID=UPI001E3F29FA|nr:hypothetical protein [Microbacterium sp. cx-59]MCC4906945.1 hypothetical protein [Microbacterium sp. cx-59]